MFEKDDDDFPVKCPVCGEEFHEKVGRIKAGLDSRCPDCKTNISHPATQFTRLLEDRDNAMRDYFRQFIRLTYG